MLRLFPKGSPAASPTCPCGHACGRVGHDPWPGATGLKRSDASGGDISGYKKQSARKDGRAHGGLLRLRLKRLPVGAANEGQGGFIFRPHRFVFGVHPSSSPKYLGGSRPHGRRGQRPRTRGTRAQPNGRRAFRQKSTLPGGRPRLGSSSGKRGALPPLRLFARPLHRQRQACFDSRSRISTSSSSCVGPLGSSGASSSGLLAASFTRLTILTRRNTTHAMIRKLISAVMKLP